MQREWSREQIEAALRDDHFGYQNVALPYGLETGGEDRSDTARAIFGDNVEGKSVFDLGSRFGFFCFYAEERGAEDILGTDIDPENVRKSRLLAEIRKSRARFSHFDIEREEIAGGPFDYVLCLNVLHHLRNPLAALDRLIAVTGERLVIEVAAFSRRGDRRNSNVSLWSALFLNRFPIFYVARDSTQTFFITVAALKVLLLEKRADFARVDVVPGGPKGRPILIAHRRKIGRLLVVAGVPASGKSTFIDHLQSESGHEIARQLGFAEKPEWSVLHFRKWRENEETTIGDLIIHYNISEHLIDGDLFRHSNALSDLISIAGQTTVVTLACPLERLLRQFTENRIRSGGKLFRRRKNRRLLRLYQNRVSFNELYADWFAFFRQAGLDSYVVKHDGGPYSVSRENSLPGY